MKNEEKKKINEEYAQGHFLGEGPVNDTHNFHSQHIVQIQSH